MEQELVKNKWSRFEDKADVEVPTATLMAYEWIDKNWPDFEKSEFYHRCSEATICSRRRWYAKQGTEGTPLTPRKRLNFMAGDVAEIVVKYIISAAMVGDGKIYSEVFFGEPDGFFDLNGKQILNYKQIELKWTLPNGSVVRGHPDGLGKRNSDGEWELIEVKSAANWGFDSFKKEGAGDYLRQAHSMMLSDELKAKNVRSCRFFYFKKETGHLWDRLHHYDDAIAAAVIADYISVDQDIAPAKPFSLIAETRKERNKEPGKGNQWLEIETGRKTIGFPCTYCPYVRACHGEYTIEWKVDARSGCMTPTYYF